MPPFMKTIADAIVILDQQPQDKRRFLLLQDMTTNNSVSGFFYHGYDFDSSISSIAQLFDQSFTQLGNDPLTNHSVQTLPIVHYVGRHRITLVLKLTNGEIVVGNGEPDHVDSHFGLE